MPDFPDPTFPSRGGELFPAIPGFNSASPAFKRIAAGYADHELGGSAPRWLSREPDASQAHVPYAEQHSSRLVAGLFPCCNQPRTTTLTMQPRFRIHRTFTFVAAASCAGLLVAACGASSPSAGNQKPARPDYAEAVKMSQCMRTHRIPDFPDPPQSGGSQIQASRNSGGGSSINVDGHSINESAPAFQKAMGECQKYAPQGPPITAAELAKIRAGALAMAKCMRSTRRPELPGIRSWAQARMDAVSASASSLPRAMAQPWTRARRRSRRPRRSASRCWTPPLESRAPSRWATLASA